MDKDQGYRPEIDGLRALAVTLVVLFHFDVAPISGGYVGVDVFFVVSGYLITQIIVRDIERKRTLDLPAFFVRRARRLLPALFAVIALTIITGFLLMGVEHYEALSASALFATLGLSNIYFGATAGYFDLNSDLKPLLHTWSLGVEMQFYLGWPLLLLASAKVLGRVSPVVVIGTGILSYVATLEWERTSGSIYYLPQFRVFEFVIGAGLLWAPSRRTIPQSVHELFTAAGLLAIIFSSIAFDERTPFPGTNALVPCLGAALVMYGGGSSRIGLALRNRVVSGIGKISYSVYLLHWPVWVFYKYYRFTELRPFEVVGLVAVTFAGAVLLYFTVEKPLRKKGPPGSRALVGFSLAALALMVPSGFAWAEHGLPFRVSRQPAPITGGYAQCDYPVCTFGDVQTVDFVVAGDSHARHLFGGLATWAAARNMSFAVFHFDPYCRLINAPRDNKSVGYDCPTRLEQFQDFMAEKQVRHLIFAHRWRDAAGAENSTANPVAERIAEVLTLPELGTVAEVAVVLNVPEFYENRTPQGCIVPSYVLNARDCEVVPDSSSFYAQIASMNVALAGQVRALVPGAYVIDPFEALCEGGPCRQELDGTWLYADAHHLSDVGSNLVIERAAPTLDVMMGAGL